ncbi:MAG: phosphatase PAP2 family protein [Geobacteraceae bacterium]|nr:phosphatase PAP2 family protein [Geobacteraceae bacterium]
MSSGRFWAELWMVLVLLMIATGLLAHSGADLRLSACFYRAGGWPIGEQFPWKLLYRIDRIPAVLLAFGWLVVAIRSVTVPSLRQWRRAGIFLVLLLILGPGLLVNSAFKEHWGRPRPRDVIQLGGSKEFLQPWQSGISGKGRSFPSGHSSAAFFLATPWFVYRYRKPVVARCWFWGGIVFGVLMSMARIVQGGHFLTDCLWAFGMVWLAGQVLAALLMPEQGNGEDLSP